MASKIDQLRKWKNNETFNARDYVFERDKVVNTVNTIIDELDTNTNDIGTNVENIEQNRLDIVSNDGDITNLQNGKVNKAGDTMTGALTFSNADETRLVLGDNVMTTDSTINATSFDNGDEVSDAIKFSDLTSLFDVGEILEDPSSGENWLDAYSTALDSKFSEFKSEEELNGIYLRVDGTVNMTDSLNMGGQSITNVNQVDGVDVSTLAGTVSSNTSSISGKVDKTTKIANIDLQNDISLTELKTAIGNAIYVEEGSQLDGLMSSEDKKNLDNLVAKLGLTEDGDEVVNTLNEIISVFNQYPEQMELQTRLTSIENALTPNAEENIQSNWDEDDTNSDAHILNKPSIFEKGELSPQKDDPENPGTNIPDFDTQGVLDERYYTEKELDPSAEANVNVLDARYYTETELNNGQLNNLYYTEVELNAGQLDTRYYTEGEVDSLLADKVNLSDLETTLTVYATDTYESGGDFDGYAQLVTDQSDSRYNDTAVEVYTTDDRTATGTSVLTSTDPNNPSLVGQLIADAEVFDVIGANTSISTIGQVKKHAGNPNENPRLRFRMFKSDDLVNPIAVSGYTDIVDNADYENIFESAIVQSQVDFTNGERLVILYEAYTTQGSPIVAIKFGGEDPSRTVIPQTFEATISSSNVIYDNTTSGLTAENVKAAIDEIYAEKGVKNGVATLDGNGTVPLDQLPFALDDVLQGYLDSGVFYEEVGLTTIIPAAQDKLYIDIPTNSLYRYNGSSYIAVIEVADIVNLDSIPDVDTTGKLDGWVLKYNATSTKWEANDNKLGGLNDVDVAGATNGQYLTFDGTNWGATALPSFSTTLADLDDTTIGTPVADEFLVHDGTDWKNRQISKTDVDLNNVQNYGIASQAEAEVGTLDTKYMTPLKTSQATIDGGDF